MLWPPISKAAALEGKDLQRQWQTTILASDAAVGGSVLPLLVRRVAPVAGQANTKVHRRDTARWRTPSPTISEWDSRFGAPHHLRLRPW
jgi:hypothetical protein